MRVPQHGVAAAERWPMAVSSSAQPHGCCHHCGVSLSGPSIESSGGLGCCSTKCLKARRRALRSAAPGLLNAAHASLPFDRFRAQRQFHHIDLEYPGLQLISERPYVFIVNHFLSDAECELLLSKARGTLLRQQLVGESEPSERTSTGCVARRDEIPALRRRIARLARVREEQLQPLKISRYERGQRFAEHCDAIDGDGVVDEEHDYYADAARVERGTRGCPMPGANRFITLFVYLNDVPAGGGGRTCFRWRRSVPSFYDAPSPSGMRCTTECPEEHQLAIRPEKGLAVLHFPSMTAEAGGYTDRNASHESEPAVDTKWVCQQFIWSHPVAPDALSGTLEPAEPLSAALL